MPIADVEIVTRPGERLAGDLAGALADALGAALGCAPGRLWVRLRPLAAEGYAENGAGDGRPSPVFVTLLAYAPPEGEVLERTARAVAQAVAGLTGRESAHVHLVVEPAARGRVAFGGEVAR